MDRWYPTKIAAGSFDSDRYDESTIRFLEASPLAIADKSQIRIAEVGIWDGATSRRLAEFLANEGELHLFDYQDTVDRVAEKLTKVGFTNVVTHGSSYKYLDSYNWSFKKLLEANQEPIFNYVYVDGAHTWAIDGFTFFLADFLLKRDGYIDFDDLGWRLRGSSLDPARVSLTADLYTDEQIDTMQVRDIVRLLVKRTKRYRAVGGNKIYQKLR